ncbi:MAG: type II toxin-antitoxin system death-on-curing family toxin [Pseudonocardiales bacterium]|nr:type II toxin-antitoxin system death-on-curing family toxin [Pseudonocardiales bacterium]
MDPVPLLLMGQYPTLPDKAGAFFHGLCANHAFIDGNKGTATYAAVILCDLNDFKLTASNDEVVELAVAASRQDGLSVEDVTAWFRSKALAK